MKAIRAIALGVTLVVVLSSSLVFADSITYVDPATLQISQTLPPTGSDPNPLTGSSFYVYQNQGGAGNLDNPWLLIIGVPNTSSTNPFGSGITSLVASAGGTTSSSYLGLSGTMTSHQEAYSVLGLQGPTDNSNSFTNWAGTELSQLGITASSFGLYEFTVNAALAAKGNVGVTMDVLPEGSIVIAYGQIRSIAVNTSCKKHSCTTSTATTITIFDTPFTQAGFKDTPPPKVPEPASVMMLGTGLGLAGLLKRRLRK